MNDQQERPETGWPLHSSRWNPSIPRQPMDVPVRDGPARGRTVRVDRQSDGKPPAVAVIALWNGHAVLACGTRPWHATTAYVVRLGDHGYEYVVRRPVPEQGREAAPPSSPDPSP